MDLTVLRPYFCYVNELTFSKPSNTTYENFVFNYAQEEDRIRKLWLQLSEDTEKLHVRIIVANVNDADSASSHSPGGSTQR